MSEMQRLASKYYQWQYHWADTSRNQERSNEPFFSEGIAKTCQSMRHTLANVCRQRRGEGCTILVDFYPHQLQKVSQEIWVGKQLKKRG